MEGSEGSNCGRSTYIALTGRQFYAESWLCYGENLIVTTPRVKLAGRLLAFCIGLACVWLLASRGSTDHTKSTDFPSVDLGAKVLPSQLHFASNIGEREGDNKKQETADDARSKQAEPSIFSFDGKHILLNKEIAVETSFSATSLPRQAFLVQVK
jgi:hypothetical protein